MERRSAYWLPAIVILVFGIRLYLALQTPNFADDASYFDYKQVESILNTGLPIYEDSLSYSGTLHHFSPVFYYLLAIFGLFFIILGAGSISTKPNSFTL